MELDALFFRRIDARFDFLFRQSLNEEDIFVHVGIKAYGTADANAHAFF